MKRNVEIIYESWILTENPSFFRIWTAKNLLKSDDRHPFRPVQPTCPVFIEFDRLDIEMWKLGRQMPGRWPSPAMVETKKNRDDFSNQLGGWSNIHGNWFNGNIWKYEHHGMYWELLGYILRLMCDGHPSHDGIPKKHWLWTSLWTWIDEQSRPNTGYNHV